MRWLWVVIVGLAFALLACGGLGEPAAPPPPAPAPVAAPPPPVAVPVEEPAPPPPPEPRVIKATPESVALYLETCDAELTAISEDIDGTQTPTPACHALDVDQFCGPDAFGCFSDLERCRAACGDPCDNCQSGCARACTPCKEACNGDEACLVVCAQGRATCTAACLTAREGCLSDCEATSRTCWDTNEARVKKDCPNCGEIGACMWEGGGMGESRADACLKRFPGNAADCASTCYEMYQ